MRTTPHDGTEAESPLDVADALSRLDDDRELLCEIIEIFLEDAPLLLDKTRRAVMANDPVGLQRAAHNLKGLAVTLSASDVASAASRLEHMASTRTLVDAAAAVTELEQRLAVLTVEVRRFVKNCR